MENKEPPLTALGVLRERIEGCRLCPRLVTFREEVPPKPLHKGESYWRRPTSGFGDEEAWLLLIGPAPAAHGGNRTGRMFTGDLTSDFLMQALFETGFANQPRSLSRDDGLKLSGCYLTDVVKCAPPKHRPQREECLQCSPYLQEELKLLGKLTHLLALGSIAFEYVIKALYREERAPSHLTFGHGRRYELAGHPLLYSSYHPSPRNTQTKRLTLEMFKGLLLEVKREHEVGRLGPPLS